MAHVLQGLTELDPETTVTSINGIGAYDTISREAMLRGLQLADDTTLPFVCMFHGSPSEYLWGWSTKFHKVRVVSRGTH